HTGLMSSVGLVSLGSEGYRVNHSGLNLQAINIQSSQGTGADPGARLKPWPSMTKYLLPGSGDPGNQYSISQGTGADWCQVEAMAQHGQVFIAG
ncbi:MAG: hypothetical protein ABL919_16540, partial [Methylococcales bacterium]